LLLKAKAFPSRLEELLRLAQRLQCAATVNDYAPKPSAIS